METLVMIGQVILALAILITLHELGHFWAARMFGIRVEKFYLFFDAWGIKLFSFKKGDTEYGIGWLPLGGYVKIAGMIDESLDKEQLNTPAQDWEFRSKPAWQRLIVMIGGVTVNAVLGILIFACSYLYYGEKYLPNKALEYGIYTKKIGKLLGFQDGDIIKSINGKEIERFDEITNQKLLLSSDGKVTVIRNNAEITIMLPDSTPKLFAKYAKDSGYLGIQSKFKIDSVIKGSSAGNAKLQKNDVIIAVNNTPIVFFHQFEKFKKPNQKIELQILRGNDTVLASVTPDANNSIGFRPFLFQIDNKYVTETFGFAESFSKGFKKAKETISMQLKAFGLIFSNKMPLTKSLAGPIQIAQSFGGNWIWEHFWELTALISIVLAFMNLLPIPALDGGHVLFLIIEMIIRRPLPEKFMYYMQVIGMFILITLMVFIFGNDIYQVLLKRFG